MNLVCSRRLYQRITQSNKELTEIMATDVSIRISPKNESAILVVTTVDNGLLITSK
jgi:hypothetical protein